MADKGEWLDVSADIQGKTVVVKKRNPAFDDWQDPHLFDDDYNVAGFTGFLVWDSCWIILDLLRGALGKELAGRRVLELGSGTGFAGLCAAASGAHVLLTDLASVTEGSLRPNVLANADADATTDSTATDASAAPTKGATEVPEAVAAADRSGDSLKGCGDPDSNSASPWAGSVRVGAGTAAVAVLDWEKGPREDDGNDPRDADIVLAVDCVWLRELVPDYVDTVAAVLNGRRGAATPAKEGEAAQAQAAAAAQAQTSPGERVAYMAFAERGKPGSKVFASAAYVRETLESRGIAIEEHHAAMYIHPDDENTKYHILVYRLTLAKP